MKSAWVLAVVAVFSFSARGAETKCTSGSSERKIEVTTGEGGKPPCEVKYTKEGETEGKTLWNAANDGGFCLTKAQGLVEKLTGTGWKCAGDITGAAAEKADAPKAEASPSAVEGKTEGN